MKAIITSVITLLQPENTTIIDRTDIKDNVEMKR